MLIPDQWLLSPSPMCPSSTSMRADTINALRTPLSIKHNHLLDILHPSNLQFTSNINDPCCGLLFAWVPMPCAHPLFEREITPPICPLTRMTFFRHSPDHTVFLDDSKLQPPFSPPTLPARHPQPPSHFSSATTSPSPAQTCTFSSSSAS